MVDAVCIEQGCPAFDPMDLIAFVQEKFGQVRPILARDSCDKGDFRHSINFFPADSEI